MATFEKSEDERHVQIAPLVVLRDMHEQGNLFYVGGGKWSCEYPDHKNYYTTLEARNDARKLKAKVIRNYGLSSERTLYDFSEG